ncbi:MAG: hypothetical protein EA359_04410 [Balneolaceae bacterium]|nr:MAG: hypothetical protein EA359_04410 [Balneolaceae bacterium]
MKHKTKNIYDLITLFMFAVCLIATTAITKTMAFHLSEEFILNDDNHTLPHTNDQFALNESLKGKIVFLRYSVEDEGYQIYSMDTNGGNQKRTSDILLEHAAHLSVSPDGSKIIFLKKGNEDNENRQIWIMNADGSGLSNLTNNPEVNHGGPGWSPDGNSIVYHARNTVSNGTFSLYIMDADGSNNRMITSPLSHQYFPFWSPDGKSLVYLGLRTIDGNNAFSIEIMNIDGTERRTIVEPAARENNTWPRWSPDGTRIAFQRMIDGSGDPYQIFIVNIDGSGIKNLTEAGGNYGIRAEMPAWSPDGNHILFQAPLGGTTNLYLMDTNGVIQGNAITNGTNREHSLSAIWVFD